MARWSTADEALLLKLFRTHPNLGSAARARKCNPNPAVTYNKRTERAISERLELLLAEDSETAADSCSSSNSSLGSGSSEEGSSGQDWSGAEDGIPKPQPKRRMNPDRPGRHTVALPAGPDESDESEVEVVEPPKKRLKKDYTVPPDQRSSSSPPIKSDPPSSFATPAPAPAPPRRAPSSASTFAPAHTVPAADAAADAELIRLKQDIIASKADLIKDKEELYDLARKAAGRR